MTKQKLGDLDWDRSLDYEFEDPFAPASNTMKRGVITRVATSFKQGAKDALKTPATFQEAMKKALPKGYGDVFNLASEVVRQGEELHNVARKEVEPYQPAMRRLVASQLPKGKKLLNKATYDFLEEFAKPPPRNATPQELQELEFKRSIAEVFGGLEEGTARRDAEDRVERSIQHAQSMKSQRSQAHSLNIIQQGVMRQVQYQDDITNKWQRKTLELQTRQYFVARDSLRLQVETTRRHTALLEAIQKNSAMPDIAKQDLRHTATQTFRTKMLGGLQNSATKFAANYARGIGDRAKRSMKSFMGNAGGALDTMGDGSDGPPLLEMLASMAGGAAVKGGSALAMKHLLKRIPGVNNLGFDLEAGVENLPFQVNKWARSNTKQTGGKGALVDMLKAILGKEQFDTTVGRDGVGGLDAPSSWNKLSQRSLVEIIPGLLARIEHNTARAHDPKAQLQIYNHDRREFTSVRTAGKDAAKKIYNANDRANDKQNVNRFIDELVGDRPISDETRRGLFRQVLMDSMNLEPFDLERLTSPASETPELTAKMKLELAEILSPSNRQAEGVGTNEWMSKRSREYHQINFGAKVPVSASSVYRSIGQRDALKDQNLLVRDGDRDKLNVSAILDMVENADYNDIKQKKMTPEERLKQELLGGLKSKFGKTKDLYAERGGEAVLTEAKLLAGSYRDAITGKVLTKWSEIQGPVRDMSTKKIIEVGQLAQGLMDGAGKKINFNLRSHIQAAQGWASDKFGGEGVRVNNRTPEQQAQATAAADQMRNRADEAARQAGAGLPNPTYTSANAQAANNPFSPREAGALGDHPELIRLNTEQVDLLKVIAELLASQGGGGDGEGGGGGGFRRGFLDSIALGGIKGAWGAAKLAGKGTMWWTKKVGQGVGGVAGLGIRGIGAIGSGAAHRVGNMVRGVKDIYIQGERRPIMTAERIKMGHFLDLNTKRKITRWRDVTGPVMDVTNGETVLDQENYDKGIFVKGPAGMMRLATKAAKNFAGAVVGFYGNALALPFKAAGLAVKAIGTTFKWATNKQVDVYVKGESSPRLMATKMKTGRYYNAGQKKTGKVVTTYEDIYGDIKELPPGAAKASADDKTVLYESEIHDPGIVGRFGLALKTPLARLIGVAGGAALSVVKGAGALFGGAMKGYGKLFGGLMGFGGGMLAAPFKFLGALLNPFEKTGTRQVELLEKIFGVLDARLPGKKHRKGSWQEQQEQNAEEAKSEKDSKDKEEKDKKWGVGGLLSFFKNKAKGLFGGGNDEDDEEDDDDGGGGNTTIISGGDGGGDDAKKKREAKEKRGRGKKGGRSRNRAARQLRRQRAGRGKGGLLRRGAKGLMNPKALLAGTLISGGTGMAMDALGADENSTTGKVINGVGDVANTASDISMYAQMARMVPWLFGGGGATAAGGTAVAGGATAAAGGATAAAGTAAAGTAAAGTAAVAGTGAAATAGTAAAATAGTAAAVVGAPIWIPIAIGAAAVAAAGVAIYYGYKQFKYGGLNPVRRFRYLQYGVPPGDAGNNKKIFQLEEMMLDHIGEQNGGLEIVAKSSSGGKDITMKDVYELMGMDDGWFSNKNQERAAFNIWYGQRFKPIFLLWVKYLRELDPKMPLLDADDGKLSNENMTKLLNKAWTVSRNLYAISAGPFDGKPAETDFTAIEDAYNLALKDAGKTDSEKTRDKWKRRALGAASILMPGAGLAMNLMQNQLDESKAKKEGAAITAAKTESASGMKMLGTTGAVKNTDGIDHFLSSSMSKLGKVSALQAIRYRAYGLADLDTDRVRAVMALENLVFRKVSMSSSGNPHLPMDAEQVYMAAAGLFGLTTNNPGDRVRWCGWFGNRFKPVALAYMKAVKQLSPNADPENPERTLKPDQLMTVAQQMLNTKGPDDRSIWSWTISPWSEKEKLNSDSNAISGSMLALKLTADKKVMAEEKLAGQDAAVKKDRGMLGSMMDSMRDNTKAASDWLLGKEGERNWLGKAVDGASRVATRGMNMLGDAYGQAKSGDYSGAFQTAASAATLPGQSVMGAMGFGPGLDHPGKGAGGDINSLPNVPSNEEIAAMKPAQRFAVLKPLFDSVAKMTGVDPNMLYAICSIESTFNPGAKAPTSSASGLFQFIRGTWNGMLKKYGSTYGLNPTASPFDPKANALMGAMFLKDNFNALKGRIGRGVNETDMYMAHFMGSGGAANFLSKDPSLNAPATFPKEAAANKWIFYDMMKQGNRNVPDLSRPKTVGGVYQLMQQKVNKAQAVYGGRQQGGAPTAVSPFAGVSSSVDTSAAKASTTTTANGPSGGAGAAQSSVDAAGKMPSVGGATATTAGSTGTNSLQSGGGYAASASAGSVTASASVPAAAAPTVPAAPSINTTASLDASAAAAARDEATRQAAAEKQRQQQAQQQRQTEAQSQRMAQTDQMQMSRVGEILEKSLQAQLGIQQNTADTVTMLREILKRNSTSKTDEKTSSTPEPAPSATMRRSRPQEAQRTPLPVSMSYQQ